MRSRSDKYIVVYVADLGIAAKFPIAMAKELMKQYSFKLKGTRLITFHLGSEYFHDQHGVLCIAPKKYIKKMIKSYVCMFGQKPKQYVSPLEK